MGKQKNIKIYDFCPKCGHWCISNASTNWFEKTSHVDSLICELADEEVKKQKTMLGKLGTRLLYTYAHIPTALFLGHYIKKDGAAYNIASFKCNCGEEWVGGEVSHEEWKKKVETDILLAESKFPIEKTYEMLRTIFNYRDIDEEYNDKLSKLYSRLKEVYIRDFCEMPNYARRFVWIVKDNITFYPENSCLLTRKEASVIDTQFENGIVTDVLYIKHPYKEIYYPKDRYSVSLFEDEVEDFIDIMACIGAKKIETQAKDETRKSKNDNFSSSTTLKGTINNITMQTSESYESNEEKRFSRLVNSIEQHQFDSANRIRRYPNAGEYAWYDAKESWRRKVARVMEQGERTMDFTLSIQEELFISQKEADAIQTDIQSISTNSSIGITNSENSQSALEKFHSRELIAHVEFYGEDDIKKEGKVESFFRKIFNS